MRKTKVYRPRRGMRFSRLPRGGPDAGFVAGLTEIEPVEISGNLMYSLTELTGVNSVISASVSYGNVRPTTLRNRVLLGTGFAGTGRPYSTVASPYTASIPSWVNSGSAFVLRSLGSITDTPVTQLNYFLSGTQAVESSPVPATASLHFSKQARYQTIVVKKTASFFDTVVPFSGVIVPASFASGTGSLVTFVTGANMPQISSSYRYPATIRIDVPVSGKLVDLKVWVEIIHLSSSTGRYPLGSLGVALRSPNVRWGHAHPIRNDPAIINAVKDPDFAAYLVGPGVSNSDLWYPPANFYRDTFLLWEGIAITNDGMNGPWSVAGQDPKRELYPCWQRDRGMRTIFTDGARVPNPRQLYIVPSRDNASGSDSRTNTMTHPSGNNWLGSPNANGTLAASPGKVPTSVANSAQWAIFEVGVSAFGMDWPWTSDKTVFPATESHQANGSPPKGWLTAAGGVAGVNEWPTTGVNYGAEQIKPVYPLLESIYQKKRIGDEASIIGSVVKFLGSPDTGWDVPQSEPTSWRGFRPGLRDTEISGTWELLICGAGGVSEINTNDDGPNAYFRQVRLEMTYTTGLAPERVRRRSRYTPGRSGPVLVGRTSGSMVMFRDDLSGSWDSYVSETYLDLPTWSEVGRTFGVRLNSGSFDPSNFALIYRLTGTLADISGSAPGWLLNNIFGMPSIPESSASLVPYVPYTASIAPPQNFITPTKTLDGARRLADVAADLNPPRTLADIAIGFVSSSLS